MRVANAFDFPVSCRYIRPLFCRGIGPFALVALSGDPEDITRPTPNQRAIPDDRICITGSTWRARRFVSKIAGAHLLAVGAAPSFGLAFNEMVKSGELSAPS